MHFFNTLATILIGLALSGCDGQKTPNSSSAGKYPGALSSQGPDRIRINHDDYHGEWVGKTSDGSQFFATDALFTSQNVRTQRTVRDYVAVFLWNQDGSFREMRLDSFDRRSSESFELRAKTFQDRIDELGAITLCDIRVAPFEEVRDGVSFGLIYAPDEGNGEWVELQPGNEMAFYPPWDGRYDT